MPDFSDLVASLPAPFNTLDSALFSVLLSLLIWGCALLAYRFIFIRILRNLSRRMHGEVIDIITGIINRPGLVLLGVIGLVLTLELLPLPAGMVGFLDKILKTMVIVTILYVYVLQKQHLNN